MFNRSAQRRMHWATTFRAGDKVSPCLLRYATAVVLSEKTATTRPSKQVQRALRPLSTANNSCWLIDRETSPSNQIPEANWSATVAPQPRLEASDQNIWSGELRAREIPSPRQPSVHHHQRSSREGGSQGTRISSSRKSQPRLRANCKALIQSWPFGTRRDREARWPSKTLQNFADCTFEDRSSSAIEKNFSILEGVAKARKVCESILIPK